MEPNGVQRLLDQMERLADGMKRPHATVANDAASPAPSSALSSDVSSRGANAVRGVVEEFGRARPAFDEARIAKVASAVAADPPAKGNSGSAHRRLAAWSQMREETLQKLREEKERAEAKQLPFQPHVTRQPQPHVQAPQQAPPLPVEERLAAMQEVVSEHLRTLREVKYRDPELTFRPEVHYHPIHDHQPSVVSRSTESQRHRAEETLLSIQHSAPPAMMSRIEREELAECTFHPVIGPRSRHVYETSRVEEGRMDVYTRLYSRSTAAANAKPEAAPRAATAPKEPPVSMPPLPEPLRAELDVLRAHCGLRNDAADPFGSFLCNILGTATVPRPIDTAHFLCRHTERFAEELDHQQEAAAAPAAPQASKTITSNTTVSFDEFLQRQVESERQRREHREKIAQELAPPLHPTICKESLRLAEQRRQRDHSKENKSCRRAYVDEELTFRPVISAVAEAHPRRGVARLHRYYEQYEEHKTQLRQQKAAAEASEAPFRPATNKSKAYEHVASMLHPKNLKAYKEHLEKAREVATQRKAAQEAIVENETHAACTFHPRINRTPSYVSHMAQSFSVVREAQLELTAHYGLGHAESPRWVN